MRVFVNVSGDKPGELKERRTPNGERCPFHLFGMRCRSSAEVCEKLRESRERKRKSIRLMDRTFPQQFSAGRPPVHAHYGAATFPFATNNFTLRNFFSFSLIFTQAHQSPKCNCCKMEDTFKKGLNKTSERRNAAINLQE